EGGGAPPFRAGGTSSQSHRVPHQCRNPAPAGRRRNAQGTKGGRSASADDKPCNPSPHMKTKPTWVLAGVPPPFAKSGTALAGLGAAELGRTVVQGILTRTGLDPGLLDEVILGCVAQPPEALNIARVAALRAGV